MFRLTRLNEIQYVETEAQRDKLIEYGFVLDELDPDVLQEDPEKTDEVSRRGKRSKGGA